MVIILFRREESENRVQEEKERQEPEVRDRRHQDGGERERPRR